ncbi:MAG: ATP-binding cassette domain-containing protein [Clostridia bacterium]|nr:ATP-binding cassette domain-containing protein [Clostridia bacterium]MBR7173165.1 ATP-binding cassette domain-containing protein [Clostridia bacterium]
MSYIQVDHLQKNFWVRKKKDKRSLFREKEKVEALRDLSFQIERGELVGYIGPNGAGKSSTVKILSGILTPDGGSATIGGLIPWENRKEHVRRIGVVFGQRMQLWWDVPILDSFSLLKDIYRIPDAAWKKRLDELSGALQLEDLMRTPLRLLSLGQRMRAELCGSLLHQPELLFLDEPSIGLDSISKLALRDFLRWENREHGTTILLTTHDMEDIAALCPRVMVLGHGRKLFDGELSALLARYDTSRTVTVRFGEGNIQPALPEGLSVSREGDDLKIIYDPRKNPTADILASLQQAGTLRELTIQPQNIDHLIADMYQEMAL